ncbi:Peptidase family M48 [Roseivivax marinus]|uniref:M48 family metallopeptidase n=1 Tax=Roseivivax marinus TaxID=1379903 RepID=UPI0008CF8803|nr:M48 family metallopeptidase [Roseivivax marinus]SEL86237.1 Peptidase family M48 [Roseivivax marinus]
MDTTARFSDGLTAATREVRVRLSADRLALMIEGAGTDAPLRWPLGELRALPDHSRPDEIVLTHVEPHGDETQVQAARLVVSEPDAVAWLHRTRPALFSRPHRPGTARRLALYGGGALAAVVLMLFVILPALAGTLAGMLPPEREQAFGQTVLRQMERVLGAEDAGALDCSSTDGRAALDLMTARLTEGRDLAYDIDVRVFDHDMVNAFAAPGGQIVLIRGMLDLAEGRDEIAAVLAHEIGHVEARDPTRAALRTAGSVGLLGLLFGDFAGGAVMLTLAERLIDASYSQKAEARADRYAYGLLREAQVEPAALGDLFETLAGEAGEAPGALSHFLSHPRLSDRVEAARAATREDAETRPILDDAAWTDLRNICG